MPIRNIKIATKQIAQRTMYYASGVPMAESIGRDARPYLYNGKEFVEAHGLNTYDYGFRGYYATIGRFTSIDPLAEQTPWQSPYVYANNNFINKIDYMGLSGDDSFAHDYGDVYWNGDLFGIGGCSSEWNPWSWSIYGELVDVYSWIATDIYGVDPYAINYVAIDQKGKIVDVVNDGDMSIYLVPEGWTRESGKVDLDRVGHMILPHFMYEWIGKGHKAPGFYYDWTGTLSISIGLQGSAELVRLAVPSYDIVSYTFNLRSGENASNLYYMGENDEFKCIVGGQYIAGVDYSVKHHANTYPISGTQTWTFFVGPVYGCSDGTYGLTIDFGIIGVFTITFTGSIYYGGN